MTPTAIGEIRLASAVQMADQAALDRRYEALASTWTNTVARMGFPRAYERIVRNYLIQRIPAPLSVVADVGCGSGVATAALIRAGVASTRWILIDRSAAMLRQAIGELEDAHLNLATVRCDLSDLQLLDGSVDLLVAAHVIEHVTDPQRAIEEMWRVLRPGGHILMFVTRCSLPSLALERQWPIQCARSRKLNEVLGEIGFGDIAMPAFPAGIVPNLFSFAAIARKRVEGEQS